MQIIPEKACLLGELKHIAMLKKTNTIVNLVPFKKRTAEK